jgi:mannose-P-dolichol utilization defect protein 1
MITKPSNLFITLAFLCFAAISYASDVTNEQIVKVGNPCSNEINAKCIQWGVSKLVGFLVISLAFILKVPQIKNLMEAGSAEGLVLTSQYLDLFSYALAGTYNMLIGAPLSTYAETVVIAAQVLCIIVLVWSYEKTPTSEKLMFAGASVMYLGTIIVLPSHLWSTLMIISSVSAVFSRIDQIKNNFVQGHTGVLALFSVILQVAGNAARIFTTMTEVDDFTVLGSYLLSFALNSTIALQIVFYWKATNEHKKKLKEASASVKTEEIVTSVPVTIAPVQTVPVPTGPRKNKKD